MKEQAQKLLAKAARAIRAAEVLLNSDEAEFAAGRAYYAMFYAAKALVEEQGFTSNKHSGVHSLFGQKVTQTGRIDPKFHRWLLNAFETRQQSDYGIDAHVTREDAELTLARAREFLSEAERLLRRPEA